MTTRGYILVVDDDENDLQMTVRALERAGAVPSLTTVRDGAEALDFLLGQGEFKDRPPGAPDLVLLDLNMPRIDGWEVLRRIKKDEQLCTIPVVVFTSSFRDRDVEQCYQLGANAYVVKPISFDEFSDTVRDIRMFWTRRNRPPPAQLAGIGAGTRTVA